MAQLAAWAASEAATLSSLPGEVASEAPAVLARVLRKAATQCKQQQGPQGLLTALGLACSVLLRGPSEAQSAPCTAAAVSCLLAAATALQLHAEGAEGSDLVSHRVCLLAPSVISHSSATPAALTCSELAGG
jgi:hypothetical protein